MWLKKQVQHITFKYHFSNKLPCPSFGVVVDGQVYTWGKSQRGRLGREAEGPTHEPKMILFEGMQTVLSVSAGHGITLLLTRVTATSS